MAPLAGLLLAALLLASHVDGASLRVSVTHVPTFHARAPAVVAAGASARGQQRARLRVIKELSSAMIDLKIPGGVAVQYAEVLAEALRCSPRSSLSLYETP